MSARKLGANRANAKRSTGPRSREGKAHAAANAHRHGLATSVLADAALRGEVKALARQIMTAFEDEADLEVAQHVAEAQIDLTRVRQARHDLIQRALLNPRLMSAKQTTEFYVLMVRVMELATPITVAVHRQLLNGPRRCAARRKKRLGPSTKLGALPTSLKGLPRSTGTSVGLCRAASSPFVELDAALAKAR